MDLPEDKTISAKEIMVLRNLRHEDSSIRDQARKRIQKEASHYRDIVAKAISSGDQSIRVNCIDAMGIMQEFERSRMDLLCQLLVEEDTWVRYEACWIVESLLENKWVTDALMQNAVDVDWHVRQAVVIALGGLSGTLEIAVSAAIDALRDEIPNVRASAVQTLGKLRVWDNTVANALQSALTDPESNVRAEVLYALSRFPALRDRWEEWLAVLRDDSSVDVQTAIASLMQ